MLQAVVVPAFTTFPPEGLGELVLFGGMKILFLIFFGMYVVFSFIVIRQVTLMRHTIETPIDLFLSLSSWLIFALALVVLAAAAFTL